MRREIVETRARVVVVLAHVVFPDVGRLVAGPLQLEGPRPGVLGELREVVAHTVRVGVHARQDRGAARRAQRGRGEGVPEVDALAPNTIDVRRGRRLVARQRDRVPPLVVGQDEHDVRARGGLRSADAGGRRGVRPGRPAVAAAGHGQDHRQTSPQPQTFLVHAAQYCRHVRSCQPEGARSLTPLSPATYTSKAMLPGCPITITPMTTRTMKGREAGGVVAQAAR